MWTYYIQIKPIMDLLNHIYCIRKGIALLCVAHHRIVQSSSSPASFLQWKGIEISLKKSIFIIKIMGKTYRNEITWSMTDTFIDLPSQSSMFFPASPTLRAIFSCLPNFFNWFGTYCSSSSDTKLRIGFSLENSSSPLNLKCRKCIKMYQSIFLK